MTAAWLSGDLCAFDTETTGPDPLTARIVTATILHVGKKGVGRRCEWLINPGVPIPPEASAIHGITTEAAQRGAHPLDAVPHIATELLSAWAMGLPVVIMNASFDATLMQEELERVGHEPLTLGPILDPLVIDRALDPYRKGKRTLTALAAHYGVKQEGAHSSEGDALTAARIVWRQAREPRIAQLSLTDMQEWQRDRHAEWAGQFEVWLRQQGKPEVINREWPVRRAA